MTLEVEQKFHVDDAAAVERGLGTLGATLGPEQMQVDTYYAHPARDFGCSDEALRIRCVGRENCLTYKGPKLDATTKTRREIEIQLTPGSRPADELAEMLELLSFKPVLQISKRRRKAIVIWQDQPVEAVLDRITGLGIFVELEITCPEHQAEAAKKAIASLAGHLGLTRNERRSYLEMLLEKNAAS